MVSTTEIQQHLSQSDTVKLLLATLLRKKIHDQDLDNFTMEVTDTDYIVVTKSIEQHNLLKKLLGDVLQSHSSIRDNVEYTMKAITKVPDSAESTTEILATEDCILSSETHERIKEHNGIELLQELFNKTDLDSLGLVKIGFLLDLNLPIENVQSSVPNKFIKVSECIDDGCSLKISLGIATKQPLALPLAKNFLGGVAVIINTVLSSITIFAIKQALNAKNSDLNKFIDLLNDIDNSENPPNTLRSHKLLSCERYLGDGLCPTTATPDKVEIKFSYKRLLYIMTPPQINMLPQGGDEKHKEAQSLKFSINREHLLSYMLSAFGDGFLLGKNSENKIVPFFFSPKNPIPETKTCILILDVSGSMQGFFDQYKKIVAQFIKQYYEQTLPGDLLEVVIFNQQHKKLLAWRREYNGVKTTIAQLQDDVIRQMCCDGRTALNLTLREKLLRINDDIQGETYSSNVNIVVFTDGEDNSSNGITQDDVIKQLDALREKHKLPRMFTFGLGECYDQQFFNKLATCSGVEHTHLTTLYGDAKYNKLFEYLNYINIPRKLYSFVQELIKYDVFHPFGSVSKGFPIDPKKPFQVNGQDFCAYPNINSTVTFDEQSRTELLLSGGPSSKVEQNKSDDPQNTIKTEQRSTDLPKLGP